MLLTLIIDNTSPHQLRKSLSIFTIPFVDGRTTISHTKIKHPADTAIISALNGIDPNKMLPFYTKASSRERMENLYPSSLYFIYPSFQRTSPTCIRNWSHLCYWGLEIRDKPTRKFFSGFIYYQTAVTPLRLVKQKQASLLEKPNLSQYPFVSDAKVED